MAAYAHWTAIALYLATTAVAATALARKRQPDNRLLLTLLAAALTAHGISLVHTLFSPLGYRFDLLAMLSLVTWVVNLLLLVLAARRPLTLLILIFAPIGAITEFAASHTWGTATLHGQLSAGIAVHALLSISAYSLLTLATLQAISLYYMNQQLHKHRPVGAARLLPPLQSMESLLFGLITFGQLLLTASLVTGFVFVGNLFEQGPMHKTVLSIVAWILYSILLWGHWQRGWRGNTAVRWTLSAFAALMLAYFGSKLVLEVILQRG
ncbi:cytochrome C assembly family protein [Microbulbifer spongiae]|uniref:Cytochrome c biogenesis protein CcsA n=1 Tax=Microbulbifer spongiae TaxID=2944933 RepID=A0ABY9EG14_9GAMM|nr:cytochrome c biogenesis protein CcsA [Microbulbifer sp. MI-G]WKD51227.1 cytochrome c biogenesis protein CcsA [Microbulbifer sp. MI-G]